MNKIKGVNLGNWLVLEKWMQPSFFEDTGAEDETWLNRNLQLDKLCPMMQEHRETYITEKDFSSIAKHGINTVRIPVPYFIFGDRPPFQGCIEYLDRAFDWAERYGLKILIDLHTVPGSQNGYDNGGLTGVCKWFKNPVEVEFSLNVLERLSHRYADRESLYGIEVLNEPISFSVWISSPSFGKAKDKNEAKGSWFVPMKFLKNYYVTAYNRIRAVLPTEKAIVFHDGFRLARWKDFFKKNNMKNVYIDTHIYLFAMEKFIPIHKPIIYKLYLSYNHWLIKRAQKYTPVIIGEWCISTAWAYNMLPKDSDKANSRFRYVSDLQLTTWKDSAGYFYWNYQLLKDHEIPFNQNWLNGWDLYRCWDNNWIS